MRTGETALRVAHVTGSLSRMGAGVGAVVWSLAEHQVELGDEVSVFGVRDAHTEADARGETVSKVFAGTPVGRTRFGFCPSLARGLDALAADTDVVHMHGLWMHAGILARRFAVRRGIPLVLSPHGMVEPWAMARHPVAKRLMWRLFEHRNARSAGCLHAITEAEARCVRRLGVQRPTVVIPNGVDPRMYGFGQGERFRAQFPGVGEKRVCLFLGRLHPKKGLLPLVSAWASLGSERDNWMLVIAGDDEGGHGREVDRAVQAHGMGESVLLTGPLYDAAKQAALAAASLFVLPSYSEGFSIAVLEALASRVPALVTHPCNFPDVETSGAGVQCNPDETELRGALARLLPRGGDELSGMGALGRRLVEERYSWERSTRMMRSVYAWLAARGDRPAFVTD